MSKSLELADDVHIIEGFVCRPKDLFEVFTNEKTFSTITQSPAKIDAKDGGDFSLFGGSVVGTFEECSVNKIKMKWRFCNWPDNHYSEVVITLTEPEDRVTKMTIDQTNIPERDKFNNPYQGVKCSDGFKRYYCDHVHKFVGYSKHIFDEDSD